MNRHDELDELFSPDGLVHPARQLKPLPRYNKRRLSLSLKISPEEAAVCLSCDAAECDGDPKCFRARKKLLQNHAAKVPADVPIPDFSDLELPDFSELDLPDFSD